jgi:hypothetical protein
MEPNALATEPGVGIAIDVTSRSPAGGALVPPAVLTLPVSFVPIDGPHFPPEHLSFDEVHAVPTATDDASAHTITARLTAAVSTRLVAAERRRFSAMSVTSAVGLCHPKSPHEIPHARSSDAPDGTP